MSTENTNDTFNQEMKKVSPVNIVLKWALIGLILNVIMTMVNLYMGDGKYNPRGGGWISMLIGLVILFVPITMAVKEYRDKECDGFISFGKAFRTGFIYTLVNLILTVLFMAIFYNFIIDFDTFLSEQTDIAMDALKQRGMSNEEITSAMSKTPAFMKTQWFSLSSMAVGILFMDSIVALIVAAIFKRNNPNA